jgi:polyisoprenoid-binding protein YceI
VKYAVTGKLVVRARSAIHDTTTTFDKVTGDVEAAADALEAATATFAVDMTAFDAGDWLRNRKLRNDFAMEKHPRATFTLGAVSQVQRDGSGGFDARAEGVLRWRGKEVAVVLTGKGRLDEAELAATARFDLDIRMLGLSAPSFLMIKMADEVTVDVTIRGMAAPR